MSWDSLALLILALSGALSLLLSQARDVMTKTAEVIHAWREIRQSLRAEGRSQSQQDPPHD
ncbi:hypothetical protein LRS74_12640 [Streptomyces sp. LX-29]|uniref:hypothetical protein n=1 Tax=Streptomyces sp. LX-29 TaxID=2900152 RepID=UPI00240E2EE8|nr:hypothetical protein [Streptomyces sp. LX-29]WFB07796.1 hypothetical protein LRS74_12640 [Streptomyces sp. LX-29]